MINIDEIKENGRLYGIPTTTIERDYVQNHFLRSLYSKSDFLVFKGGTAIRKAFIRDYRFSNDLDFTLSKRMEQEHITSLITEVKEELRSKEGIIFEDKASFKSVETGWKIKLNYNSMLSQNIRIRLDLDITEKGKEVIVTPVEKHRLIHRYSDACQIDLVTYSLAEITIEKIRALCDRSWPRDLYDVCNLWPRIEKLDLKAIFAKKCEVRGITPTLEKYNQNKEKLKIGWSKSLEHQLKEVPDFENSFLTSLHILKWLEVK